MWKVLNINVLNKSKQLIQINAPKLFSKRFFLSEAYYCNEVWNQRLNSELLKKVNLDELYHELDQTFQQNKNISAVDVDIFANAVGDADHIGELRDLVHKLRLSADCGNTLPSTGHATIRLFLETNSTEELLQILDDRLNYGIFVEPYDANILMNKYIKNNQNAAAARVGVQLMLQEDLEHDLARSLTALSCYLYLINPNGWPIETEPEPESKEEIKIRVGYLRNPSFDDHFDLREPLQLIGKTLYMIGLKQDDILHRSLQLLGLSLYGKTEKMLEYIEDLKSQKQSIIKHIIPLCKMDESLSDVLTRLQTEEVDFQELLKKQVNIAEQKCAERDISTQCKLYQEWEKQRIEALENQKLRLLRIERLDDIDRTQKELKDKEMKLWFFEREEQLELEIDAKKVYYPKRWFGKKKKPRKIDENYIPPEVFQRRE